MEFESENEIKKVPTGVKVIAILEFVFKGFGIIGSLFSLIFVSSASSILSSAELDQVNAVMPSTGLVLACVAAYIAIIVGAAMTLKKNKIGVFLYFIAYVVVFILNIVQAGFSVFSVLGLILPILMAIFISKEKELFGL